MSLVYYFTIYCPTCFECQYIHLQERATCCGFISCIVLLWFVVCWCYAVARLGWSGIIMQAEALALVTCFIISLFNVQHVSNVSTSIFRSLRLVDLFHVLYCSVFERKILRRQAESGDSKQMKNWKKQLIMKIQLNTQNTKD